MIARSSPVLKFFVAALLLCGAQAISAQEAGIPFPRASAEFKPKVTYEIDVGRAWRAVTAAINENKIPIEIASRETNQITTGYRMGPSEGGGIFAGKLLTQYRYVVSLVPTSAGQTQIQVSAALQARRLAATLGKIMSGNNAVSDVNWFDATAENPAEVAALEAWLYEQIELKVAAAPASPNIQPPSVTKAAVPAVAPAPGSDAATPSSAGIEDQLERLKSLRRRNVITESEYKALRAKALGL